MTTQYTYVSHVCGFCRFASKYRRCTYRQTTNTFVTVEINNKEIRTFFDLTFILFGLCCHKVTLFLADLFYPRKLPNEELKNINSFKDM